MCLKEAALLIHCPQGVRNVPSAGTPSGRLAMAEAERQLLQALLQLPRLWPGTHIAAVSTESTRKLLSVSSRGMLSTSRCAGSKRCCQKASWTNLVTQGWLPGERGVWERRWSAKETPLAVIAGELCRLAIMRARPNTVASRQRCRTSHRVRFDVPQALRAVVGYPVLWVGSR